MDYTGTGNSLNMRHPHVAAAHHGLAALLGEEMHVDGFRFDLAVDARARAHDVDRLSAFFDIIHQDPVLTRVKLIAEPWDVGEGGYQVGNFPVLWSEWNGKYRDTRPRLLARQEATLGEFAAASPAAPTSTRTTAAGRTRASTSSPRTTASRCTTSCRYNEKHNQANGEDNRDGESHNRSWNWASEGPTDDPTSSRCARGSSGTCSRPCSSPGRADAARRRRDRPHAGRQQQRLLPGQRDHLVRLGQRRWALLDFTRRLIALRRAHPVFRRRGWFTGRPARWLIVRARRRVAHPEGRARRGPRLGRPCSSRLGVFLNGDVLRSRDERGRSGAGRQLSAAVQRARRLLSQFTLPGDPSWGGRWSHRHRYGRGRGRDDSTGAVGGRVDRPYGAVAAGAEEDLRGPARWR